MDVWNNGGEGWNRSCWRRSGKATVETVKTSLTGVESDGRGKMQQKAEKKAGAACDWLASPHLRMLRGLPSRTLPNKGSAAPYFWCDVPANACQTSERRLRRSHRSGNCFVNDCTPSPASARTDGQPRNAVSCIPKHSVRLEYGVAE